MPGDTSGRVRVDAAGRRAKLAGHARDAAELLDALWGRLHPAALDPGTLKLLNDDPVPLAAFEAGAPGVVLALRGIAGRLGAGVPDAPAAAAGPEAPQDGGVTVRGVRVALLAVAHLLGRDVDEDEIGGWDRLQAEAALGWALAAANGVDAKKPSFLP
jgi:hypothetical protein